MLVQVFHYSLHNTDHTERLVPAVWSQQWKHQLSCQSVEEQLTDAIECLILYVVLQAGCRGLGREVGNRWLTPARHLQRTVAAKTVTVVGILMVAEYLTYMLADHFHVSVVTNSFFLSLGIRLSIFHARESRILPTSSKPPLEEMSGESNSTRIFLSETISGREKLFSW